MVKIEISEKALKRMADLESECDDFTAINPKYLKPIEKEEEEINYEWDLAEEEAKESSDKK